MNKLFFTFFISFAIVSCGQNIEDAKLANEYVKELEERDLKELKAQLKNDITFLNKLVEATSFEFQLTSHFSSGQKIVAKKSVPEFKINYNVPEITERFNTYCKQVSFEQNFRENYSEGKLIRGKNPFSFSSNLDLSEKDSIFEQLKSNIEYKEEKVFFNGNAIGLNQIGLKKIDSISTNITLEIPLAFDKFSIEKNHSAKKEYKGFIVKRDTINENIVELKIPTELYKNIIGYQAFNKKGVRMNVSAFSSNSLLEINQTIKDNLNSLKNIFQKIVNENNEDKAKSYLKGITQSMFDAKNEMLEFDNFVIELGENKKRQKELGTRGIYDEILEKGKKVLWVQNESAIVEFPDDVLSIEIYVKSNSIKLERKQIVLSEKDKFYDNTNPNIVFSTFERGKGFKYGISDKNGNKIIEAIYDDEIRQTGNEYFSIKEKLHWLDVANKKMVGLPAFKSYKSTIKPGYDIFDKTIGNEDVEGVVKNGTEIILPFEYFRITKYKNFIVADKGYDKKVDFFDVNFKEIQKKEIHKFHKVDDFIAADVIFPLLFVAENADGKKALVDSNLKYLTPFKYDYIRPFFSRSDYYTVSVKSSKGYGYLYTLIDQKGNEIAPPIFDEFNLYDGKVTFDINKKTQTMDFSQFLKTYGK
ncbi:WG repeat-containing protein [Flavobacterium procerum]|uniref:WG repeat-containing protein n=1 Tax=Flavobacterium procerum TaxID=1455569 RepID=A0ABV6BUN0_9FLAO